MNELNPIFPNPVYANILPIGSWMCLEAQVGIDLFCQEVKRDSYVFRVRNLDRVQAQQWISGLIAFVSRPKLVTDLESMSCPIFNVSANLDEMPYPSVLNDGVALGRGAAEHLITCGAKSITLFTFEKGNAGYRGQRRKGVQETCEIHNIPFKFVSQEVIRHPDVLERMRLQIRLCTEWLEEQSSPLAVIAVSPLAAYVLAQSARQAGIVLGRDLALIQLTDPRESMRFCDTSISYIGHDWRQVGYRAMELLYQWVEEGKTPPQLTWIPPLAPVLTPSSDASFQSDLLTRFKSFLLHSGEFGIQVGDVASALGVSDSKLLRELKLSTGLSAKDHLVNRQLQEAKRLLRTSNFSVEHISQRCGYRVVHSMNAAFRKHEGMPPGEWRKAHRNRPDSSTV